LQQGLPIVSLCGRLRWEAVYPAPTLEALNWKGSHSSCYCHNGCLSSFSPLGAGGVVPAGGLEATWIERMLLPEQPNDENSSI
jgi:hypothetical protein